MNHDDALPLIHHPEDGLHWRAFEGDRLEVIAVKGDFSYTLEKPLGLKVTPEHILGVFPLSKDAMELCAAGRMNEGNDAASGGTDNWHGPVHHWLGLWWQTIEADRPESLALIEVAAEGVSGAKALRYSVIDM